jgi:hypothetical protein
MLLIIDTQYRENYGAHDWDGEGECPQRWKNKGGSSIKVSGVPESIGLDVLEGFAWDAFSHFDNFCEESVLGVRFESDDYMSNFEKSQLEYEGFIQFAEPTFTFREMLQKAAPAIAFRKELEEAQA